MIHMFNETTSNISLALEPNPTYENGHCQLDQHIFPTQIHLSSFDINNPMGHHGPLYNIDQIVIPDTEIMIEFKFPLRKPLYIQISSQHPYTLRQLLFLIHQIYKSIYEEEEQTSNPQTFQLERICECATRSPSQACMDIPDDFSNQEHCSICYEYLQEQVCELISCQHHFHRPCIEGWINHRKDDWQPCSCPLCRTQLNDCQVCSNTRFVQFEWTGVVVPSQYRMQPLRNLTDGIYGIYDYDFEQLLLDGMMYSRQCKTLTLSMRI